MNVAIFMRVCEREKPAARLGGNKDGVTLDTWKRHEGEDCVASHW